MDVLFSYQNNHVSNIGIITCDCNRYNIKFDEQFLDILPNVSIIKGWKGCNKTKKQQFGKKYDSGH